MHSHVTEAEFLATISGHLACYYFAAALMNGGAAWYLRTARPSRADAAPRIERPWVWALVGLLFAFLGLIALGVFLGTPAGNRFVPLPQSMTRSLGRLALSLEPLLTLPAGLRWFLDMAMGPMVFCGGITLVLAILYRIRTFFVRPLVAWSMLNLSLLWIGLSLTDPDFAEIVTKPDNDAIVAMVFLLGFFTWLSAYQAVRNDERLARGEVPLEALESEKILVWPDLVYIELICMVAVMALLIVWSIGLKAPLEEPANFVKTPNPSKAPWYFVGLQEMLYYFEPWMAGVVLPGLILFGLMAIPYLDVNRRGSGYYTIDQRKFAYLVFQFGFLVLWISLILLGTFLRGPNWVSFGFYETWDVHKVEPQINVNLSQYVWARWLGMGLPQVAEGAGRVRTFLALMWREFPGVLLLSLYFAVLPWALAKWNRLFREFRATLGVGRYVVMVFLLLVMVLLPLKMIAVWTIDCQYIVALPEYGLNF